MRDEPVAWCGEGPHCRAQCAQVRPDAIGLRNSGRLVAAAIGCAREPCLDKSLRQDEQPGWFAGFQLSPLRHSCALLLQAVSQPRVRCAEGLPSAAAAAPACWVRRIIRADAWEHRHGVQRNNLATASAKEAPRRVGHTATLAAACEAVPLPQVVLPRSRVLQEHGLLRHVRDCHGFAVGEGPQGHEFQGAMVLNRAAAWPAGMRGLGRRREERGAEAEAVRVHPEGLPEVQK
mmetsp:Transcript_84444/g.273434  ORF Transcript_84444/g.273434 Transcript_84444/m.273434 type:complete len:233 (+) Transcript_84444:318-1016(+)